MLYYLGHGCWFSVVDSVEKLAVSDFVGDITRQQPVTTSVMSRVLMLQLAFIYLQS